MIPPAREIEAGEFTNDSEYLRNLVRRDQAKKKILNFIP